MKQGELALIYKEHNEDPVVLHQSIVHPHNSCTVFLGAQATPNFSQCISGTEQHPFLRKIQRRMDKHKSGHACKKYL